MRKEEIEPDEKKYEHLPTLAELCEQDVEDVKDEVAYIFALYGLALGYLQDVHPASAWMTYGSLLLTDLADFDEREWANIQVAIATTLERRAHGDD